MVIRVSPYGIILSVRNIKCRPHKVTLRIINYLQPIGSVYIWKKSGPFCIFSSMKVQIYRVFMGGGYILDKLQTCNNIFAS